MPTGKFTYFVSDVHLGLAVKDEAAREARFVDFLRSIDPAQTESLYLLGDIWDFWYEYHDVVPKGYVKVFAALIDLMEKGVNVYFFQGNHDIWTYRYFEQLGMKKLQQPYLAEIGGKTFCLGHGDGLGPCGGGYKLMRRAFRSRFLQAMFSFLHPWMAFRIGKGWSKKSRLAKSLEYDFRGEVEPIFKWCESFQKDNKVDYFVFGHYHCKVDMPVGGARLMMTRDWMDGSSYLRFDGTSMTFGYSPNNAK